MGFRRVSRLAVLALIALFPSFVKRPLYRWLFGFRIGSRTTVGLALLDAQKVSLGEETRIGHFNAITRVGGLRPGTACVSE